MTVTGTYLDKIRAAKRAALSGSNRSLKEMERALSGLPPTMDFAAALRSGMRETKQRNAQSTVARPVGLQKMFEAL